MPHCPTAPCERLLVPNYFPRLFMSTSHMPFRFRNTKQLEMGFRPDNSNRRCSGAHCHTRVHTHTYTHLAQIWSSTAIKEMCNLGLQVSHGAWKMINAHFRALDGNHDPLQQCHPGITMTTTKRLPSSVAKTIEILIKAIHFFFLTDGRKTSTRPYPEIHGQEHFQNSKLLLEAFQSHMICPSLPKGHAPALSTTQIL